MDDRRTAWRERLQAWGWLVLVFVAYLAASTSDYQTMVVR